MNEKKDCPCKRTGCPRHGDCEACREHHKNVKHMPTACERLAAKAARKKKRAR